MSVFRIIERSLSFVLRVLVLCYQLFISPLLGGNCRHNLTCSNYAIQILKQKNIVYAVPLIALRILKCNPFF
ncbi:membrane protein insertion efficiency factor YidD [bacterium]|nr:membrane protein insertion efficiency factor YidD [bacterium]